MIKNGYFKKLEYLYNPAKMKFTGRGINTQRFFETFVTEYLSKIYQFAIIEIFPVSTSNPPLIEYSFDSYTRYRFFPYHNEIAKQLQKNKIEILKNWTKFKNKY